MLLSFKPEPCLQRTYERQTQEPIQSEKQTCIDRCCCETRSMNQSQMQSTNIIDDDCKTKSMQPSHAMWTVVRVAAANWRKTIYEQQVTFVLCLQTFVRLTKNDHRQNTSPEHWQWNCHAAGSVCLFVPWNCLLYTKNTSQTAGELKQEWEVVAWCVDWSRLMCNVGACQTAGWEQLVMSDD